MGTVVILLLLMIVVIVACYHSRQHFRGMGGCCGGTENKGPEKHLQQIVDKRKIRIGGMHCQNCEAKIKDAINRIDYLACQKITHQQVIVVASIKINEQEINNIIEKTGYQVIKMEKV